MDDAEAPHIHLWACVRPPQEELWGREQGAAAESVQLLCWVPVFAKAAVQDIDIVVGIEEQAAQLLVPAHHALLVAVLQSQDQLVECALGLPLLQAVFGLQVGE